MSDEAPPANGGNHYHQNEFRARVSGLEKSLRDILRARDQVSASAMSRRGKDKKQAKAESEALAARLEADLQRNDRELQQARERLQRRRARNQELLKKAYFSLRDRYKDDVPELTLKLQAKVQVVVDAAKQRYQQRNSEVPEAEAKRSARILREREELSLLKERLSGMAADFRIPLSPEITQAQSSSLPESPEKIAVGKELEKVAEAIAEKQRGFWMRTVKRFPLSVFLVFVVIANAALAAGLYFVPATKAYAGCAVATLLLFLWLSVKIYLPRKEKIRAAVKSLYKHLNAASYSLDAQEKHVEDKRIARQMKFIAEMKSAITPAETEMQAALDRRRDEIADVMADLDERFAVCSTDMDDRIDTRLRAAEVRHTARAREIQARSAQAQQALAEEAEASTESLAAAAKAKLAELKRAWDKAFADTALLCSEFSAHHAALHPAWDAESWSDWRLPEAYPESIYFGDFELDLKSLQLGSFSDTVFTLPQKSGIRVPVTLSFPNRGSLFLSAGAEARDEGVAVLMNTILRLLTRFPAGKAQFTVIDPVGLGQSFAALMHLADFDESIAGLRIWTQQVQIERVLSDLTDHIETVIQKYLRNRYESIDEFNAQAGELAEAYQFVVLSDFPAGFSELALDRLDSIITSGQRCGVYTLILHDARQPLPAAINLGRLRENGLVLVERQGGFVIDEDVLRLGAFQPEALPGQARLNMLLESVGIQVQKAKEVKVDFGVIRPETLWAESTEASIRVPLGRAGADRLQYLDLGKGTAQHALISGKTGSGKSTLFHVIITNLALTFGPDEIEFYLIDYKKGVEFKTYANHHLPHARVIAIESDREFGLSVLQRLDREFARRADLFRKAGVQDFANYRKAGGEKLPRTVLLIDEFQEFFVEDDAVAQSAALLLDRIVRQGRAFGVHVILGSQTLGGAFTLAKSTMGQMGVRIALACNEADSYLILGDDNGAARTLTRPGEAIYNDMSGLVEANNPFQIVWISDKEEEGYLQSIEARAKETGWRAPEQTVVFEGNIPADLPRNRDLVQALEQGRADAAWRLWLGEPNAIKAPTEVVFRTQGGSNLLIVGQQSESVLATCHAAAFSLAAEHEPGSYSLILLDGSNPESREGDRLRELAAALPQGVEVVDYAGAGERVRELEKELQTRLSGDADASKKIFLVVYGLQRFRQLRQSEDFEFSSGDDGEDGPAPDRCFSTLLTEGPVQNMHVLVWCDSLNNLNRSLGRRSQKEFELRMLYQMSATDSSEMIDLPTASRLGLYKALLYIEEHGSVEIFRPYALPEPHVVTALAEKLTTRTKA